MATRFPVGGFTKSSVAAGDNATPASSTPVACAYQGAASGLGYVATRSGNITGISAQLDANPAGSAIVFAATVNGTVQAGTAQTLNAGTTRKLEATFGGSVPYSAGDVVGVSIRTGTGWTATSANCVVGLELTN